MSAIDRTPLNINYLQPDGFVFVVKKLPTTTFFTQNVNIPALQLPPAAQPNPFITVPVPGDHIVYDDLVLNFKVDEDLRNYVELYNWICGLGYPDNYDQYANLAKQTIPGDGLYSDISVLITTNIKNTNIEILYKNAFPIALSGFTLSTTEDGLPEIASSATFKFTKYNITTLPSP